MVEYDYNENKIKRIVKYPKNIYLESHCCCTFHNKIYIVDGKNIHTINSTINKQE